MRWPKNTAARVGAHPIDHVVATAQARQLAAAALRRAAPGSGVARARARCPRAPQAGRSRRARCVATRCGRCARRAPSASRRARAPRFWHAMNMRSPSRAAPRYPHSADRDVPAQLAAAALERDQMARCARDDQVAEQLGPRVRAQRDAPAHARLRYVVREQLRFAAVGRGHEQRVARGGLRAARSRARRTTAALRCASLSGKRLSNAGASAAPQPLAHDMSSASHAATPRAFMVQPRCA